MKGRVYRITVTGIVLLLLVSVCAFAEQAVPQVPITYPGDTESSIGRRAQWIEGAKKEGVLYWWGVLAADRGKMIIDEFNKVYPFIRVEYWRGNGEEIATKLQSEIISGRHRVDICLGGEEINFPTWRKSNALAPFAHIVPDIEKMDRRNISKSGDWIRLGSNVFIAAYNTRLVSPAEAPKSYEDLLDQKWKGKIGITPDVKQWWSYALGEGGWGVEKTERFLSRLKGQDLIYGPSPTVLLSMLIAGEYKIAAQGYLYRYLAAQDRGAPIEWIRLNPVVVGGSGFIMSAGAPHPNAAKLFLEWMLSPRGLAVHDEVTAGGSAFPGMGTRQSRAIEGLKIVAKTEETALQAYELGLEERFAKALGITK